MKSESPKGSRGILCDGQVHHMLRPNGRWQGGKNSKLAKSFSQDATYIPSPKKANPLNLIDCTWLGDALVCHAMVCLSLWMQYHKVTITISKFAPHLCLSSCLTPTGIPIHATTQDVKCIKSPRDLNR